MPLRPSALPLSVALPFALAVAQFVPGAAVAIGPDVAAAQAATADEASSADEAYTLPEGASEQRAGEIITKAQRQLTMTSKPDQIVANFRKMMGLLDETISRDYSDATIQNAASLKFSLYNALRQLGEKDALAERATWVRGLAESERPVDRTIASGFAALDPVISLAMTSQTDVDRWRAAVQPTLDLVDKAGREQRDLEPFELEIVMAVAEMLDGPAPQEVAGPAFAKLGQSLAKSDDPRLQRAAEMLAATGRRYSLPGSKMVITGTTLDGEEFSLQDDLAGKVVVVDFWATWCGFCIEAFPEMKKVYAAKKDDGFEIVGVNLDENRKLVDDFLDKTPLPWTNIQNLDAEGGPHPNARRYAVSGIPFLVLVGRDGRVISTEVSPENLGQLVDVALQAGK